MSDGNQPTVKRRRVFYIPGYDPNRPSRYRELYRTESRKQAEISGFRIALRAGEDKAINWDVAAEFDGARSLTHFEVLGWSDIVRKTMERSIAATYGQLLKVAWVYLSSGALRRLMWLRKGPILAGFYPVLMLLGQLAVALLLGGVLAWAATGLLSGAIDQTARLFGMAPWSASAVWQVIDSVLGWGIFLAIAYIVLRFFRRHDGRVFAHYLMHDLAYTVRRNGAWPSELDARLDAFADRIAEAMGDIGDEVLVVGHSSGAALAVSVMARVLRRRGASKGCPELSLLTLGQAIPMISFLPRADELRRDLHDLAASDRLTWVDISAPGDGCSFALCDPVAVSGVAPEGQRWPLILSAAFSNTLTEERQEALRHRYFQLHLQYLCAFDQPGEYDYFRVTAGPLTLAQRYSGRAPSRNRIDVPASGFTSMAA